MDKMREVFEAQWGYTNEEQNCYFVSELNLYGSEFVNRAAEYKSTAWCHFQAGWRACQGSLVIELPISKELCGPDGSYMEYFEPEQIERCIEAAGLKVKS